MKPEDRAPGANAAAQPLEGDRDQIKAFLHVAALGYGDRALPIIPPGALLAPGTRLNKAAIGKGPGIRSDGGWTGFKRWQDHPTTEADLAAWHAWGASVGIRTGDGLLALDIDCLDPELWEKIRPILIKYLGELRDYPERVGRAPKTLFLMRIDKAPQRSYLGFGERDEKGNYKQGIDLLYRGRQFVAFGPHVITLEPYGWPKPLVPFGELPRVKAETINAMIDELREVLPGAQAHAAVSGLKVSQRSLKGKPETVIEAVRRIDNSPERTPFKTRKAWIEEFIYSVKGALQDDDMLALELVIEKAKQWDPSSENLERVECDFWRCIGPYRRGAGYLYDTVMQHFPSDWHPHFDKYADGGSSPRKSRLSSISWAGALAMPLDDTPEPLIEDTLDQEGLSVLFGASSIGKTAVVLDMAACVTLGDPWAGRATMQGAVLIVANEGFAGFLPRLHALGQKYGFARAKAAGEQLTISSYPLDLGNAESVAGLIAEAAKIPELRLVFLDTLAGAMIGLEENAASDMGKALAKVLEIQEALGCQIVLVHHSGKDILRGARGSSVLRARVDTMLEIAWDEKSRTGTITADKQRGMEKNLQVAYALEVRPVGFNRKGASVTSTITRYLDAPVTDETPDVLASGALRKGSNRQVVALAVEDLTRDPERAQCGVSTADVIDWLRAKHRPKLTKNAITDVLKNGAETGPYVRVSPGYYTRSKNPDGRRVFGPGDDFENPDGNPDILELDDDVLQ